MFLLRELVRFLYEENLVSGREDRVLVVAARKAWPEYNTHGLYFCQLNRSFKPSNYLAFYTDGEVKSAVPAITSTIESIELTEEALEETAQISPVQRRQFEEDIITLRDQNADRYGSEQKVLFLDIERGFTLDQPVQNDKTASESDRTVAFVQATGVFLHLRSEKIPLQRLSSKSDLVRISLL